MDDTASAPKPATPHDRMLACLGMAGLTPTERIVLAAIAWSDGDRGAYPSHAWLAGKLRMDQEHVRKTIASARNKGAVTAIKRGRGRLYRIDYGFIPAQSVPVLPSTLPSTTPARIDGNTGTNRTATPAQSVPAELEENRKANVSERFPVLEGGSASAREPTVDAGAPPSRAHVAADEPKSEKPPALPSPERFAKQQEFDALRAGFAERRKAEAQAHSARMIVEADAQWASAIAKAAGK